MPDSDAVIDVEELVEDLRRRVAAARGAGLYATDVGEGPLEPLAAEPRVRFRPEFGYSSKPIIGKPITGVKRTLLRLQHHVLDDLARQTDAALAANEAEARRAAADAQQAYEAVRRAAKDIHKLVDRVTELENGLERLQLGPRLARIERSQRRETRPVAAVESQPVATGTPAQDLAPATTDLDYLAFEARFRGSEETIRQRQEGYLELLGSRRRVLDVGCGRGELLELLSEHGIDAYGVDTEPDFVEQCIEKGLDVRREDGVLHLEGLGQQAVDAIMASHVAEHLEPARLTRLIQAAHDALQPEGVLILETPNPESLVAGSVNFHRDPTHLRPIHPDTLAFLCENVGFEPVEIRRLSPVPEDERLPRAPEGAAGAEHINPVVDKLNDLVFGFQDYAVVATRIA